MQPQRPRDPYRRFPVKPTSGDVLQWRTSWHIPRGRVVAVLPEGFLFRPAGAERDYKELLLRRGWLKAVIALPRGTFAHHLRDPDRNTYTRQGDDDRQYGS